MATCLHWKSIGLSLLLLPAIATAQLRGRVVQVHDGDTFVLLDDCTRLVHIRLAAIDCPELKQPYGATARRRVQHLCYGKELRIDSTGTDRYGRVLGMAILPGGDTLNHLLLAEGLAWQYTRYDKHPHRAHLQQTAAAAKAGMWRYNPVPPWEWRQGH